MHLPIIEFKESESEVFILPQIWNTINTFISLFVHDIFGNAFIEIKIHTYIHLMKVVVVFSMLSVMQPAPQSLPRSLIKPERNPLPVTNHLISPQTLIVLCNYKCNFYFYTMTCPEYFI